MFFNLKGCVLIYFFPKLNESSVEFVAILKFVDISQMKQELQTVRLSCLNHIKY